VLADRKAGKALGGGQSRVYMNCFRGAEESVHVDEGWETSDGLTPCDRQPTSSLFPQRLATLGIDRHGRSGCDCRYGVLCSFVEMPSVTESQSHETGRLCDWPCSL
jgi:hypothetical protein